MKLWIEQGKFSNTDPSSDRLMRFQNLLIPPFENMAPRSLPQGKRAQRIQSFSADLGSNTHTPAHSALAQLVSLNQSNRTVGEESSPFVPRRKNMK